MGFFSLKATCAICGKDCGLNRFQLKDKSWVCAKCFKEAGLTMASPVGTMTADDVRGMVGRKQEDADKLASFKATKQVGGWLQVDENAREWLIPDGFAGKVKNPRIHSYDDVLNFELLEDDGSIVKGGLGSAVVGGALFGGVGAVVGGVTGKKKGKPTCTSLKIKITLNDMTYPIEYINLISTETKKNGMLYQTCERQAQEILSLFQIMCDSNKTLQNSEVEVRQDVSAADEILKFKQLLDQGIITAEEFEAKKKQLLGI